MAYQNINNHAKVDVKSTFFDATKEEKMNYYLVLCKGGHVGKSYYVPICLPIIANDGREAAFIARYKPRVKHNHPDAILDVKRVNEDEYLIQKDLNNHDPYFLCNSRHEQNEIFHLIKPRLVKDPHCERGDLTKYRNSKPNLLYQARKYELESKFCYID